MLLMPEKRHESTKKTHGSNGLKSSIDNKNTYKRLGQTELQVQISILVGDKLQYQFNLTFRGIVCLLKIVRVRNASSQITNEVALYVVYQPYLKLTIKMWHMYVNMAQT